MISFPSLSFGDCKTNQLQPPCGGQSGICYTNPDGSPGGFVADNAKVSPVNGPSGDVWPHISEESMICDYSQVKGSVRIEGYSTVKDHAQVSGNVKITDAIIEEWARVTEDAQIEGFNTRIYGNAQISGSAKISSASRVSGNARVLGSVKVRNQSQVRGNAVLEGDREVESEIIAGLERAIKVQSELARGSTKSVKMAKFGEESCAMYEIDYRENNDGFNRIVNELEILNLLKDTAGIMRVIASDVTQQDITAVLEYYPYGALFGLMEKGRKLSFPLAYQVAQQVCGAIKSIHINHFAHRDIKPENILVKKLDSEEIQVAIADFDVAIHDSSRVFKRVGTLLYMHPKYLMSHPNDILPAYVFETNKRNDYWGFGVTLLNIMNAKQFLWQVTLNSKNDPKLNKETISQNIRDTLSESYRNYPASRLKIEKLQSLLECSLRLELIGPRNCNWNDLCDDLSRATSREVGSGDETKQQTN